jgi:hypothetical protein
MERLFNEHKEICESKDHSMQGCTFWISALLGAYNGGHKDLINSLTYGPHSVDDKYKLLTLCRADITDFTKRCFINMLYGSNLRDVLQNADDNMLICLEQLMYKFNTSANDFGDIYDVFWQNQPIYDRVLEYACKQNYMKLFECVFHTNTVSNMFLIYQHFAHALIHGSINVVQYLNTRKCPVEPINISLMIKNTLSELTMHNPKYSNLMMEWVTYYCENIKAKGIALINLSYILNVAAFNGHYLLASVVDLNTVTTKELIQDLYTAKCNNHNNIANLILNHIINNVQSIEVNDLDTQLIHNEHLAVIYQKVPHDQRAELKLSNEQIAYLHNNAQKDMQEQQAELKLSDNQIEYLYYMQKDLVELKQVTAMQGAWQDASQISIVDEYEPQATSKL